MRLKLLVPTDPTGRSLRMVAFMRGSGLTDAERTVWPYPTRLMREPDTIGAVVLCGGKSQRMGRAKHTLPFGDECLLQRVVRILQPIAAPIAVVAAEGQSVPVLPDGVVVVRDERPDLGPLSGLATGLSALRERCDAVYASSCDVPFLQTQFATGLHSRLNGHDLAIVRGEKYAHPLAAVYRTDLADKLNELLNANRLRPIFLLEECDAVVVSEEQMRQFDPELQTLRNVNTPEQYAEALSLAGLPTPEGSL